MTTSNQTTQTAASIAEVQKQLNALNLQVLQINTLVGQLAGAGTNGVAGNALVGLDKTAWITAEKPSALMRKGMALTRPAYGTYTRYGRSRVTKKYEVFACPVAAIYFGLYPLKVSFIKDRGSVPTSLGSLNNSVKEEVFGGNVPTVENPVTHKSDDLLTVMINLRDVQLWGRRKIARWMEKLGY